MFATLVMAITGMCVSAPLPSHYIEPTKEQLEAATKAVEQLGGAIEKYLDPQSNRTIIVFCMSNASDADMKKFPVVPFSFSLQLSRTELTNAGLKELANQKNLSSLDLCFTDLRDKSKLKELANLKNLSSLDLQDTGMTDAGLKEIAKLTNLSSLNLSGNRTTDLGMKEIAKLTKLSSLNLYDARVTDFRDERNRQTDKPISA